MPWGALYFSVTHQKVEAFRELLPDEWLVGRQKARAQDGVT